MHPSPAGVTWPKSEPHCDTELGSPLQLRRAAKGYSGCRPEASPRSSQTLTDGFGLASHPHGSSPFGEAGQASRGAVARLAKCGAVAKWPSVEPQMHAHLLPLPLPPPPPLPPALPPSEEDVRCSLEKEQAVRRPQAKPSRHPSLETRAPHHPSHPPPGWLVDLHRVDSHPSKTGSTQRPSPLDGQIDAECCSREDVGRPEASGNTLSNSQGQRRRACGREWSPSHEGKGKGQHRGLEGDVPRDASTSGFDNRWPEPRWHCYGSRGDVEDGEIEDGEILPPSSGGRWIQEQQHCYQYQQQLPPQTCQQHQTSEPCVQKEPDGFRSVGNVVQPMNEPEPLAPPAVCAVGQFHSGMQTPQRAPVGVTGRVASDPAGQTPQKSKAGDRHEMLAADAESPCHPQARTDVSLGPAGSMELCLPEEQLSSRVLCSSPPGGATPDHGQVVACLASGGPEAMEMLEDKLFAEFEEAFSVHGLVGSDLDPSDAAEAVSETVRSHPVWTMLPFAAASAMTRAIGGARQERPRGSNDVHRALEDERPSQASQSASPGRSVLQVIPDVRTDFERHTSNIKPDIWSAIALTVASRLAAQYGRSNQEDPESTMPALPVPATPAEISRDVDSHENQHPVQLPQDSNIIVVDSDDDEPRQCRNDVRSAMSAQRSNGKMIARSRCSKDTAHGQVSSVSKRSFLPGAGRRDKRPRTDTEQASSAVESHAQIVQTPQCVASSPAVGYTPTSEASESGGSREDEPSSDDFRERLVEMVNRVTVTEDGYIACASDEEPPCADWYCRRTNANAGERGFPEYGETQPPAEPQKPDDPAAEKGTGVHALKQPERKGESTLPSAADVPFMVARTKDATSGQVEDIADRLVRLASHGQPLFLEDLLDLCPSGTGEEKLLQAMRNRSDVFGENRARTMFCVAPNSGPLTRSFLPISSISYVRSV